MARISKWANIQHRKGAQDRRRSKISDKLIREISTAARSGGMDQGSNWRLRLAVDRARALGIASDVIDRAIKRPDGDPAVPFDTIRFEGYGPGGSALMVDCLTDNLRRTVTDVRNAFTECGGSLGAAGSVSYLFNQVGLMTYPPGTDEETLMAVALRAGAEDVVAASDGSLEVLTDPLDYETVCAQLNADGFTPPAAEITQRAAVSAALEGPVAASTLQLIDMLEDLDDVQSVYSNAQIPDEVLARV